MANQRRLSAAEIRDREEAITTMVQRLRDAMAKGEVTFAQVETSAANYQCERIPEFSHGLRLEGVASLYIIRNMFIPAEDQTPTTQSLKALA